MNKCISLPVVFLSLLSLPTKAQNPITSIITSNSNVATSVENNIAGAGYSFSSWVTAGTNFTINYASAASGDISSVATINTATVSNMSPVNISGAIARVNRLANAAIPDTRNFITNWNRISSGPLAAATTGTFNCVSPKVASMEAALLSKNINSGYDNVFQNTTASPHYNNIERVDYIIPSGVKETFSVSQVGVAVFDRGAGDGFKIAAITSVDASNNPTGYGSLITVTAANFSSAGLLGAGFDFTIFVSDPTVASGEHRPSTRNNQDIRGVFISFSNMGVALNQRIYGYSLFGQDVDASIHTLTNPSTFPNNTNNGSVLDLVNVTGFFKTALATLPVNLKSFTAKAGQNQEVQLQWITVSEQNVLQFEIERSYNNLDWQSILTVAATNSPAGHIYSAIDRNATANKIFYRCKITDADGKITYSIIAFVNRRYLNNISISSYGNKAFVISSNPIKQAELFDFTGKKLRSYIMGETRTYLEIPLSSFPAGIYIIKVMDNKNVIKKVKILK